MKSMFKAVATVTIFSVLTRLLGFFFRIFLTRKLNAEGIGLFQMATSILGVFMTLISSGLPLTTAKSVSKYEANKDFSKRDKTVGAALVIALIVAVLSSLLVLILKHVWGVILTDSRAVEILIALIPSIIFSAVYAILRGALWGQNDFFNCGLTELLEQLIRFALTFILLINVSDYFIATKYSAFAFNLTCLLSAIITLFLYLKKGKMSFKKGEYRKVLNSAAPITGVRLASSLVQPLTTLIIPSMLVLSGYTSSEAISCFGVVMGMTFPMLFVPMSIIGSISMVLIPSLSVMHSKKEFDKIKTNIRSSINISTFISMIFIPLYLSVGNLIGIVLFDNSMSGILLQLSAICILPISLCNLSGSVLNALNLEKKSFTNYILGSLVLFACLIIFTPLVGIHSIIISFFLSMSLISFLNLKKIKAEIGDLSLNFTPTISKYCFIIIPCSLLGHFVSNICQNYLNLFFSSVAGGSTAILCVLILSKIFNLFDLKDFFALLKSRKKSKTT